MADIVEELKATCAGQPQLPPQVESALAAFHCPGWVESDSDVWQFANFPQLFNYLRGCKHLVIPAEWANLVPRKMREATQEAIP